MSQKSKEKTYTSSLLVEGKHDDFFIMQLCPYLGIEQQFHIIKKTGIEQLKKALKNELKNYQVHRKLWVLIDADEDPRASWTSFRDILIRSGFYTASITKDTKLAGHGSIFTPDDSENITVGFWMLPNNLEAGMLEDFIFTLIKKNDTLIHSAESFIDGLERGRNNHANIYKSVHRSKAKLYSWLAVQNPPGDSIKLMFTQKLLRENSQLLDDFKNWLLQLNDHTSEHAEKHG